VKARWAVQRQIAAGFAAAQIAKIQERITGGVIPEWLTAESREEARGYQETAIALIEAHRAARHAVHHDGTSRRVPGKKEAQ
jgi:hypothetical protein